ncbi:MAG: thiamine pyrophosphate-requiring protein [Alphaproteobacteria bacterium]
MDSIDPKGQTVGDAYLSLLADRGVDYLFANSGTDFAPLIEGFVKASGEGRKTPIPVTVPHENVAVSMAMGYFLVSGRAQAVMVHVSVGTGNSINGLLNASRGQIPILMTAGRTPITESGVHGTRDIDIHWGQEMFDQAGMVREMVKWDYELRNGHQLETVVDRAMSIAMSEPRGPVYLTMPREVLAGAMDGPAMTPVRGAGGTTSPYPDLAAIDEAAAILAAAERPLIITQSSGVDQDSVPALAALAERFAIPVVQYRPRSLCLPASHPMHLGFEPGPLLEAADAVLVVNAAVPWLPDHTAPSDDAKIIHMAPDPLFENYPMRAFPSDLAITCSATPGLRALDAALEQYEASAKQRVDTRRAALAETRAAQRENWANAVERAKSETPISPVWLTHCISEIKGEDAIVCNEARMPVPFLEIDKPGTFLNAGYAGGLGWGLGTAVGAKMAAGPDRLVIATEGDGAYMFSNPIPAHYVSLEQKAPILTVIYNNRRWDAVRGAVTDLYPEGHVSRSNEPPLVHFDPSMQLSKTADVVGGYGEQVTDPEQVIPALERAIKVVTEEKRQAILDVVVS